MRILLIHDYGTPVGGAEVLTLRLREGLKRRGHDARLFSTSAGDGGRSRADYSCFGTTSRLRILSQTANPSALHALRRVIRDFRPDVVHVRMFLTQMSPLILPALRGTPAIYHAVWYRAVCPKGTKLLPGGRPCGVGYGLPCLTQGCVRPWDWPLLMAQMRMWRHWRGAFRVMVANSHHVAGRLREAGIEPVEVLWNGTEEQPPRPPLDGPPAILFAGRLVPEKGVDTVIRALARTTGGGRLDIAGEGPERGALELLARQLGVGGRVRFLGHVSRDELRSVNARTWVQVAPSRWDEPFGLVAPEAMMRGIAVIASDGGGLREIVEEGVTGYLCPPGDVDAWAGRLQHILGDRELAERLGAQGRRRAMEHFHEDRFVDGVLRLYDRAIATPPVVPEHAD